jgi:hypothetical protein
LWLFSVFDSLSDHSFSHSMNTHEPNMRFHLFDGFLDSLSCGLGRVHGLLLEHLLLVHDFVLVMLLLVLFMLFPLEIIVIFLMITLVLFLELIFHGMFLTQILHF